MTSRSIAFLFFFFFSCQVIAEIAGFPFETEAEEQRFRELSTELRCLVCQNQSLADSNAGLAQDLRVELYEQVLSGNSNKQIIDFMTNRYGDFILYKPRFTLKTLFLWLTPITLFIIGVVTLICFSRKQGEYSTEQVSDEELNKIRSLIDSEDNKK